MELAQIAHPKFRDDLIDFAKSHHYIFFDQLPPTRQDLLFLENYKSALKLANGRTVAFRPLLPSDEFSYRNFFYSLQEETIYFRFFYRIKSFSHEMAQKQWASIDYRRNISLIGLVQKGGHKEIMAIGSYAEDEGDRAEVAFVVREDFQGMGVGTYLLGALESIARENGYRGFTASVLAENGAMLKVFQRRYPELKITESGGGEMKLDMPFAEDSSAAGSVPGGSGG
jgi:GNAT superfamily N-acetyltransferase